MVDIKLRSKAELLQCVRLHPAAEEIDERDVPVELRKIIPYAEIWGVSDDDFRGEVFQRTPPEIMQHVSEVFKFYEDNIEKWLAGDESLDFESYTSAYIAFSSWVMGMDGIY